MESSYMLGLADSLLTLADYIGRLTPPKDPTAPMIEAIHDAVNAYKMRLVEDDESDRVRFL